MTHVDHALLQSNGPYPWFGGVADWSKPWSILLRWSHAAPSLPRSRPWDPEVAMRWRASVPMSSLTSWTAFLLITATFCSATANVSEGYDGCSKPSPRSGGTGRWPCLSLPTYSSRCRRGHAPEVRFTSLLDRDIARGGQGAPEPYVAPHQAPPACLVVDARTKRVPFGIPDPVYVRAFLQSEGLRLDKFIIGDHGSRAQELSALGSRHRLPGYASIIWAFVLENPCTRISQLFSAKSVDTQEFSL